MKNRKREICTSGTVRDEDGNILIYSATRLSHEPCLGVKVNANLLAGCSASQARVSLEICAE
jgi:hypothetical protein